MAIKSFGDKATEEIFNGVSVRKYGMDIQRKANIKLMLIAAAVSINDLRVPPGNKLKQLQGERSHLHQIRVNDQYRITFEWIANPAGGGDAYNVTFGDNH